MSCEDTLLFLRRFFDILSIFFFCPISFSFLNLVIFIPYAFSFTSYRRLMEDYDIPAEAIASVEERYERQDTIISFSICYESLLFL